MTNPLENNLQEAQQFTNKTIESFSHSDDSQKIPALQDLAKKIIPLVEKNLPEENGSPNALTGRFAIESNPNSLFNAEDYAQKCVLAHPDLFPFFTQIFPNLSSSFEQIIEDSLIETFHIPALRIGTAYLSYMMPKTPDALEMLLRKIEKICAYKNEIQEDQTAPHVMYEALAKNCTARDLLVKYVFNTPNVDKTLLQKALKYKIQEDLLPDPRVFALLSQFCEDRGWGPLPACFESQILGIKDPSLQKVALSRFYAFLDSYKTSDISLKQFPLYIKNQALWLVITELDRVMELSVMGLMGSIENSAEKEKILSESFQRLSENFSLGQLMLLSDEARIFLVLCSLAPIEGISQEMCDALLKQMLPHFMEKQDRNLEIFNIILCRLIQTIDLNSIDKEYLLSRILEESDPFACVHMIKAIRQIAYFDPLEKTKLEKSTFEDILRKTFLADKGSISAIRKNNTKAHETEMDPLTFEIVNSDGFKKDDTRDKNYKLQDKQTISEVQGCTAFCEKTFQYVVENPSVLSPSHLKTFQTITSLILRFKRFGHTFNLKKMVKLPNDTEMRLEGFNETFVIPMVRAMFDEFAEERTDLITQELYHFVSESLSKATWHENASDEKIAEIHKLIHDPNYNYPVVVGSGWVWHSTQVIFYKGKLYYCNRGADCKKEPGIVVLEIGNKDKITPEFLKKLASRLSVDHSEYTTLGEIKKELETFDIAYIAMKEQRVGNCVYANAKAAILTLLMLGAVDENKSGKQIYKAFSQFDKETILEDFLLALEGASLQQDKGYLESLTVVADTFEKWVFAHAGKNQKIGSDLAFRAIILLCQENKL